MGKRNKKSRKYDKKLVRRIKDLEAHVDALAAMTDIPVQSINLFVKGREFLRVMGVPSQKKKEDKKQQANVQAE